MAEPPGMDNSQLMYLIVFSTLITLMLITSFFFLVYVIFFRESLLLPYEDESACIPEPLQYAEINYDCKELYDSLSATEKVRFKLARKFYEFYRPVLNYVSFLSYDEVDATYLLIRDRGIRSFYFESYQDQLGDLVQFIEDEERQSSGEGQDEEQEEGDEVRHEPHSSSATEHTPLIVTPSKPYWSTSPSHDYRLLKFTKVPFTVHELTEVSFLTSQMSSARMNLPLPYKNRKNDTIYFETKLFEFNPNTTTIAIGLVTKPYPNFQLPGMSPYSVAVQTDGTISMNNMPFINDGDHPVVLPQLLEGDVIGLGYRSITGAVFVTHNGKSVLEIIKHLRVELYPCIGSVGGPCKVSVNLGQLGFVFIEANVKKLGFCENQNEGSIGAPPKYSTTSLSKDPLLDKGEELPPRYPEDEQTFFGPKSLLEKPREGSAGAGLIGSSSRDQEKEYKKESQLAVPEISRSPTPASAPPSYKSDEKKASEEGAQPEESEERLEESTEVNSSALMDATEYERMVNNFRSPTSTPPILTGLEGKVRNKRLEEVGETGTKATGALSRETSATSAAVTSAPAENTASATATSAEHTASATSAPADSGVATTSRSTTPTNVTPPNSSVSPSSDETHAHKTRKRKNKNRRKRKNRTTF
ncbi:DEKNAAC104345 [Brettanomyces naardenensis]|uniref:DEKNAAC104345 n=1 Tax=Brettanomyces naardenensis TaxID=13370 RepID=A0A448YQN9_BRENA|nr:DEKNAAC104345 [Brettanomyces naardenensis]